MKAYKGFNRYEDGTLWCRGFQYEVVEAASEHFIDNGVWKREYDNNEYGNGLRIEFRCDECDHKWTGKKGVTIDAYRKNRWRNKTWKK